ncbi:hypothetical protein [Candidatus Uabimicrobium sp. HlEnr_7]|uniref:hypothetical protein n=1 Tax=Candidatus Uabimicrobium helgolandensis TaxID=3095367 RepID=UPI0035584063
MKENNMKCYSIMLLLLTNCFFYLSAQEDVAAIIKTILEKNGKSLNEAEDAIFQRWKKEVSFDAWKKTVDKKLIVKEKNMKFNNKHFYTFPDKELANAIEVKQDKHIKTFHVFEELAENINNLEWEPDFSYKTKEFVISSKKAKAFMHLILLDNKSDVLKETKKAINKAKLIEELEKPLLEVIKDFQKEVAKRIITIRKKNDKILEKLADGEKPKKLWHLKFELGETTFYALSEDILSEELQTRLLDDN